VPSFRTGVVVEVTSQREGLQRVRVRFADSPDSQRAYNLTQLTGSVRVDDEVVCNTTAVELGLGTGGWHVVHWNLAHRDLHVPGHGHIMKVRYTSLQNNTGAAEEHLGEVGAALDAIPVVACTLHSQVGVVAAAFAARRRGARLAYVMTDGAALPLAISDLVHELTERRLLCGSVTVGHAFGGTHEAVTLTSGLSVARHVLAADAIVVGMGPGVVGTGTILGHTALEQAEIVHATATLGGRSVVCLRVSEADERPRHRGVSHHSITALRHIRPGTPYDVAVPSGTPDGDLIEVPAAGRRIVADVGDIVDLLGSSGLRITTMGRSVTEDPSFFRFAAAGGCVAATMVP
jgi:hypothetical protein